MSSESPAESYTAATLKLNRDHYPSDVLAGAVAGVAVAAMLLAPLGPLPQMAAHIVDAALIRARLLPSGEGAT